MPQFIETYFRSISKSWEWDTSQTLTLKVSLAFLCDAQPCTLYQRIIITSSDSEQTAAVIACTGNSSLSNVPFFKGSQRTGTLVRD